MSLQSKYWKKAVKQVKDYFTFSKGESIGLFILISLIIIVSLFYFLLPFFINQKKYDFALFDSEVNEFLKTQDTIPKKTRNLLEKEDSNFYNERKSYKEHKLNPFPFDPNTLTHDQWLILGLTEKQIKVIENYRAKGGKYYNKNDFRKMYCISEKTYEKLEPYIEIKLVKSEYPKNNNTRKEIVITKVEINSASIDDLINVKGIGNYFATKIVEYRIKLGGYYNIYQLLEIPKMDTARFIPLIPYLDVNPNYIRKINVNKADFEILKSHPYIGYNIALSLVNYRIKHGNFMQLDDIKKSMLINETNFFKISKYLCVD